MQDYRQCCNEVLGLYCYNCEDSPREWSLWRDADEAAEELQLTPWMDLGPQGGIWVIWDKGEEYMLVLERRDDDASPPVLQQALMHLPSGRQTEFIFAGDPDWQTSYGIQCVHSMGQPLMLTYPCGHQTRSDVRGAALYDGHFRELVGPCIAVIHPCREYPGHVYLAIRPEDGVIASGVFDCESGRFVVPAEYREVFAHEGRWVCNRAAACDVRDVQGQLLVTHLHTLHRTGDDDGFLHAERDGLWGRADAMGRIVVEPYAAERELLNAEPIRYARLSLKAGATKPLCLEAPVLASLVDATGELGMCIKYEGVQRDSGGDGMLDACHARLPGDVSAILLEDRWGNQTFLVLVDIWRDLPAGTVLTLKGSRVSTLPQGSAEDEFLQTVLAQSIDIA